MLHVKQLGVQEYLPVWHAMQVFTTRRSNDSVDEIWVVEHPPVFTQGLNGKPEHILDAGSIPVIQVDRGGQVTYHGPGQVVIYLLVNLRRAKIGVREFVTHIEHAVIQFLAECKVTAYSQRNAPGVYVDEKKIAALGLRIKRGCSYHGLAFNVDMDLRPFDIINPCGYQGLEVTQLRDLHVCMTWCQVADRLVEHLRQELGGCRT